MLYPKNSNTNDISEYMTANRHINFIGCNSDDNMRDSLLYMKLLLYFCITLIIDNACITVNIQSYGIR